MTLQEWLDANPYAPHIAKDGASQVFSLDPALYRLDDFFVSSAVSGPSVMLVRRSHCRVCGENIGPDVIENSSCHARHRVSIHGRNRATLNA